MQWSRKGKFLQYQKAIIPGEYNIQLVYTDFHQTEDKGRRLHVFE